MENQEGTYCNFFGAFGSVYTLLDQDGYVFYVGATTQSIKQRLHAHKSSASVRIGAGKGLSKKDKRIIKSRFNVYVRVELTLWVTGRNAFEAQEKLEPFEKTMIDFFVEAGCELCNHQMMKREKYTHKKAA